MKVYKFGILSGLACWHSTNVSTFGQHFNVGKIATQCNVARGTEHGAAGLGFVNSSLFTGCGSTNIFVYGLGFRLFFRFLGLSTATSLQALWGPFPSESLGFRNHSFA